ncbi:MAG: Eco57I restriction-modification methylase domain-containing protein [Burkholderiales bacterium]|nr:Eco57I restriction-modification methylase domain-containing protein [Burkholderiales bacterium]
MTAKRSSVDLAQPKGHSPAERFAHGKDMARGFAQGLPEGARLPAARAFCFEMLSAFWTAKAKAAGSSWKVARCPVPLSLEQPEAKVIASALGAAAAAVDDVTAGYLLGTVYTAMLPVTLRSEWGAFYTPPQYVEHLLDQAERAGIDWSRATAADPACGGGAFLAPMALRMWQQSKLGGPELALADIARRLRGFELDPFAAWMSHVTLEAALLPLCASARKRMPKVIHVGDSMQLDITDKFDLVAGNPPYSKVKVTEQIKARFARSLYGHANLYGIFTDLAVRMVKPGGVVAFVTPTSFLGGQYFKALRGLLLAEAPPVSIDFIAERSGVFDDVLQETLLVAYKKGVEKGAVAVSSLETGANGHVHSTPVDDVALSSGDGPWVLPREPARAAFLQKLRDMPARLSTYGFTVSTGPLVWNRHKDQMRQQPLNGALPLVWAESVSAKGFGFSAQQRNHAPYIQVFASQPHLVIQDSCVLVQRTTAKEQERRLVCAVLPQEFIDEHGGVVVENHLNVVRARGGSTISSDTIAAVLSSRAVDAVFRCISGSVAVSAYELNAIPLPSSQEMRAIEKLVASGADRRLVEKRLDKIYGLTK